MTEYRIIRAHGTVFDLEVAVRRACDDGWTPVGGPFEDADARAWCQSMTKAGQSIAADEVRLREPGKRK